MFNKSLYLVLICCSFVRIAMAQTGIGTTNPHASAKLDITSTNKGFLPPRVSLTGIGDATTISSPATGLLVYCKGDAGLAAGYYYWNGSAWATIATAGGSGSFAASFLRGSRSISQSISVGGPVIFTQTDNISGQDISLNTTTGKITLTAGNTYRLIASVPNFSGSRPSFTWYNETTGANIGSAVNAFNPNDAAGNGAFGGIAEVIITPNVNTVVYLKLVSVGNSTSTGSISTFPNGDFLGGNGNPWFEAQVISGNAPVTGQSVDYVSVQSSGQTVVTGNTIKFQNTLAGNIPYNSTTGNFTLTAGKTYRLTAYATLDVSSSAGAEIDFVWKNGAGDKIGNYAILFSENSNLNASGQGVADIIYTPSTNTTVSVYVEYVAGTIALRGGYTNAIITQIGSSAIVNPWVLSGNDVYNITGEVGIGTNTPDASAILDVSSTSKGLLPPRVALTSKNETSTPIASPATGLVVYNIATAGSGDNIVIPGLYNFNGTEWTRMGNDSWSTPETLTISAITNAPTKGAIVYDKVSYRRTSETTYEVAYNYAQSTAGTAGSGDYLFSLPSGLSFGNSVLTTNSSTYETVINRAIIGNGFYGDTGGRFRPLAIIPYNSSKFRIVVMDNAFGGQIVGSAALPFNTDGISFKFSFKLDIN